MQKILDQFSTLLFSDIVLATIIMFLHYCSVIFGCSTLPLAVALLSAVSLFKTTLPQGRQRGPRRTRVKAGARARPKQHVAGWDSYALAKYMRACDGSLPHRIPEWGRCLSLCRSVIVQRVWLLARSCTGKGLEAVYSKGRRVTLT